MYSVSSEVLEALQKSGRKFRGRIEFEDSRQFSEEIITVNLSNGSQELSIGKAYSAILKTTFFGLFDNLKNKRFSFSVFITVAGTDYEIPMGKYVVITSAQKRDVTEITAYDLMYLAERTYRPEITFPASIEAVTNEITALIGISFTGEFVENFVLYTPTEYSMREMLGICAALSGCNAYIDRFGNLQYKWYENSGVEVSDEQIYDPTLYDSQVTIDYLEVTADDNTFVAGDLESYSGIVINNPFFTESYTATTFEKIKDFSFFPAEISFILGNPILDPWNTLIYRGKTIPCQQLEFFFDGGLSCNLYTYLQDESDEYQSPADREAERQQESQKNDRIILDAQNKELVDVRTEINLFSISFTTKADSLPVFEFTAQLETPGIETVVFDLTVDGSLLFSYMQTVQFGFAVIAFIHPLRGLLQGGHTLTVTSSSRSGESAGEIQAGHAHGILWGDGLLSIAEWDGLIQVDEPFVPQLVGRIAIQPYSENVSAVTQIPQTPTATDVVSVAVRQIAIGGMTEGVEVETT